MKKILYSVICLGIFFVVAAARAEDLHDINVLNKRFDNIQNFKTWYNSLNQKNKNLVLTGTMYSCRPDLTKISLDAGGDINTKLMVIDITSGHDDDYASYIYAYNSGNINKFIYKVLANGMKRSSEAVKKENCGHTFSTMNSGTPGVLPLLSAGIRFCKDDNKLLEMLQLLSANGSDINETNDLDVSPLSEAIESKNIGLVKFLLQNGADFNKTYALSRMIHEYYSYESDAENEAMWDYVIMYLQGHKLNAEVRTDAYIQGRLKYDEDFKPKFEKLNLYPDYKTEAAKRGMLEAAERNDYGLLREMIENGVDVNYQDNNGRTALFFVAKHDSPNNEDVEMVQYLLDYGADANIKDKKGKTAFDGCAYKICQLNPNGARKISPDDETVVPTLNQALEDNDCATIVKFIKNGVDPFMDIYGTQLFFRTYYKSYRACLPEVLKLGIDLNKVRIHRDNEGKLKGDVDNALTYANRYDWSKELIPLLKQYGAVETDDVKRVVECNEMWDKYRYEYVEQAADIIKQKLKQKDLKDWEVYMYKELLKKQKDLKEYEDYGRHIVY